MMSDGSKFTILPEDDLLEITQDHLRRFGLEGSLLIRGVAVVEVVLPNGARTYKVLKVGDVKSWEARGLMGEALSDLDSRNLLFWIDVADYAEDLLDDDDDED